LANLIFALYQFFKQHFPKNLSPNQ
jgi:hypothetical protein